MKSATYRLLDGDTLVVSYDEEAPCRICHQPVGTASMGGTDVCPACDMGKCRFCGVGSLLLREELDGGRSLREWRQHMIRHRRKGRIHI